MIAFGPVPSRRLGRSLGINHMPPKVCTYSCAYCQVGRTNRLRIKRRPFLSAATVAEAVEKKLEAAHRGGEPVDYLTFVPDGEPTLDAGLGLMIAALRPLGIPIGVVTNGSLLDLSDVRAELAGADWVSLKVDTVDEERWRQLNRPHRRLHLPSILEGIQQFAAGFRGRLVTETMLLAGLNDSEAELRRTASFVGGVKPATAYVAAPTRPPAEPWAKPATPSNVTQAYEVFRALAGGAELLVGYEGDAFAATDDPREDLLAITAVHPMRDRAVARLLDETGAPARVVAELVRRGELVEVDYGGHRYFVRPTRAAPRRAGDAKMRRGGKQ